MGRFWYLFLWPLVTCPITCGEALVYLPRRDEGLARIEVEKQHVETTGEWRTPSWWTDSQDPLNGFLDFPSFAWVTAIKGHGDCEDAMALARAILSGFETMRVYIQHDQGFHAVLLWHRADGWVVISNMVMLGFTASTAEALAWMIYGSYTKDVMFLD